MTKSPEHNQAFIDGQNLHYGTTHSDQPWKVDLVRFRKHLEQKYNVETAYYFLGAFDPELQDLYTLVQQSGFVLIFREHISSMSGHKKGNVDTDIVFSIMQKLYIKEKFDKVVLVSGDGDYKRMVSFLIEEGRFKKLIAPARKMLSSLYRKIDSSYIDVLDTKDKRTLLGYKKSRRNKK